MFYDYAGLLDLILTAVAVKHTAAAASALFLLRNLALAPENKVQFVANPRALPILLAAAARAGQQPEAGSHAASALWALVYQGEKVSPNIVLLLCLLRRLLLLPCASHYNRVKGQTQCCLAALFAASALWALMYQVEQVKVSVTVLLCWFAIDTAIYYRSIVSVSKMLWLQTAYPACRICKFVCIFEDTILYVTRSTSICHSMKLKIQLV